VLPANRDPLPGDSPRIFRIAAPHTYKNAPVMNFGLVLPPTRLGDAPVRKQANKPRRQPGGAYSCDRGRNGSDHDETHTG